MILFCTTFNFKKKLDKWEFWNVFFTVHHDLGKHIKDDCFLGCICDLISNYNYKSLTS